MSRRGKTAGEETARTCVTVEEFFEAGRERLNLTLLCGAPGIGRPILEAAMNRSGLALTGFFQYFAHKRIQVVGHAEMAYLGSLAAAERERRLRAVFERQIPCLVITRNRRILPEIHSLGEEFGTPVLGSPQITMHFVNAATILMEDLLAPRLQAQGTMIEIHGIGTLIEGPAGIGKSETSLALIRRGCSLVSDDVTALRRDSAGAVIASAIDVTRYHMEIRGLGIIHVPSLFGVGSVRGEKTLDLIITLVRSDDSSIPDPWRDAPPTRTVLGVEVPQVVLPVAPGRDLANMVEAAALDQKLKRLGHDAAKELDEKLKDVLSRGGNGRHEG